MRESNRLFTDGQNLESLRTQELPERVSIPSQKMIWRIIQNIRRGQPPFAIWHAHSDHPARPYAHFYFLQEFHRRGLVLQHFEKCDHIKQFIPTACRKLGNRKRKDSLQTKFLFCKPRGVPVKF